jgi:anhydro-N-acetylmuramic acid kinase
MKAVTQVIGLMSGTSLDGVDIACCNFYKARDNWHYEIIQAETIAYTEEWKNRLLNLTHETALNYVSTHVLLGRMFGTIVNEFIAKHKLVPQLIASHGHTIFHQPELGFTSQIADGSQIAALSGIDTVCDFRSKDLALGGQGAPLVPYGDQLLFAKYRFCLNLGGIANITFNDARNPIAFDITIANMALNEVAQRLGKSYDKDGVDASRGKLLPELLQQLNDMDYFKKTFPKSLGREWFEKNIQPLLVNNINNESDILYTLCEHIGEQTGNAIRLFSHNVEDELLITGGGAFNKTLINRIQFHSPVKVIIPDALTICFKEALIFAFLGLLNMNGEVNINNQITGSTRSHIGGALYKGS